MNPGRLDRLAQFYALREETAGTGGAPRRTFKNPVALWLALEKDRSSARYPADQAGGARDAVEVRFIARFSDSLTAGSRLRLDGQTYEIKGAVEAPGPRRAYLLLSCRAIAGTQPTPSS